MSKIEKFRDIVVPSGLSMIEAVEKLTHNASAKQFLVVVDDEERLVGTFTDGDLRRALLFKKDLSGKISEFMRPDPLLIYEDEPRANWVAKLNALDSPSPFIPIVTRRGELVDIFVPSNKHKIAFSALIMAGGFGKRLGNRTKTVPKPLIKVGDKPLLEHVLSNIEAIGISNIYVSVHYLSDMIIDYLNSTERQKSVVTLFEDEPLGTAGCLANLPELKDENLIVTNCDLITTLDYKSLINFHQFSDADATIAAAEHSIEVPFGVIKHNQLGQFIGIEEKPEIKQYVAAGIYCFTKNYIDELKPNGYLDMPDYLTLGHRQSKKISVFPLHEGWTDVGRPEDLDKANLTFLEKGKIK